MDPQPSTFHKTLATQKLKENAGELLGILVLGIHVMSRQPSGVSIKFEVGISLRRVGDDIDKGPQGPFR